MQRHLGGASQFVQGAQHLVDLLGRVVVDQPQAQEAALALQAQALGQL